MGQCPPWNSKVVPYHPEAWEYKYRLEEQQSPVEFLGENIPEKYRKKIISIIQDQMKNIQNSDLSNIDLLQCNICCCYTQCCCFDCCICNRCQYYNQDLSIGDFKRSLMYQFDPYTEVRFYGNILFDEIDDNFYLTSILNDDALKILKDILQIQQNQKEDPNEQQIEDPTTNQFKIEVYVKELLNKNPNNKALKDSLNIVKKIWQSYDEPIIQKIIKKQEEFKNQCQFKEDKDFCIGKRCGYGIQITPNSLYIGYFFNNKYHGKGRLWEFKNDKDYENIEDDFKNKKKEQFFAGEKESELFDFKIKVQTQSGLYSQHPSDNNKYKDWREMKFNNGDIYKGQWKENQMHGMGHYIWANGEEYLGEYNNGLRHGFGQFKTTYNREYLGQFRNGLQNGLALERLKNGKYFQTYWKDGEKLY